VPSTIYTVARSRRLDDESVEQEVPEGTHYAIVILSVSNNLR
jgi:hypothetical protein